MKMKSEKRKPITFLMAGIELKVDSIHALQKILAQKYNLTLNLDLDDKKMESVRKFDDLKGAHRYEILPNDSAFCKDKGYGICIGKLIDGIMDDSLYGIIKLEESKLEEALRYVREDIPDAQLILFRNIKRYQEVKEW